MSRKKRRNASSPGGSRGQRSQIQTRPPTAAERREAQREARLHAARQRRRNLWLLGGLGGAGLVALIVVLVVLARTGGGGQPGQQIQSMGQDHIPEGTTVASTRFREYNSDPPTSGPHWPKPAPGGSYTTTEPDERLVHSLEHGYIVIDHNCDPKKAECDDLIKKLDAIGRRYDWNKVIVNYRPQTRSRIALTAWTRLQTLEDYDEGKIVAFIKAYRNKGPENAP